MEIQITKFEGVLIFKPKVYYDDRGSFIESFNDKTHLSVLGPDCKFVQENESTSKLGVIRGLHYQIGEYAQAKLIRVVRGSAIDVIVDIRPDSPTFGEHMKVYLHDVNKRQLYIPRGFAHGFVALEENTILSYKCDNFYYPPSEKGILFDDPDLGIDWEMDENLWIVADKDLEWPLFKDAIF